MKHTKAVLVSLLAGGLLILPVRAQENTGKSPTEAASYVVQLVDLRQKPVVSLNSSPLPKKKTSQPGATSADAEMPIDAEAPADAEMPMDEEAPADAEMPAGGDGAPAVKSEEKEPSVLPLALHTWWATDQKIDPKAESLAFLKAAGKKDRPPSKWKALKIPGNVYQIEGYEYPKQEFWLRKVFWLKSGEKKPALNLHLGQISDRDITYLNGKKLASTGDWEAELPQPYDKERLYDVPANLLNYNGPNIVLIHMKGTFEKEMGLLTSKTEIGQAGQIWREHYNRNYFEVLFLMLYTAVAGYFLFLFVRQRKSRENLFFSLFIILLIIYQFNRTQIRFETGLSFLAMKKSEFFSICYVSPLFFYFIRYFFRLPKNLYVKILDWIALALFLVAIGCSVGILFLSDPRDWNRINESINLKVLNIFLLMTFGVTCYSSFQIKHFWKIPLPVFRKDTDARLMFIGITLFMMSVVFDNVAYQMGLHMPRTVGFAFIGFVLFIALILANRFVRLHNEVEDLNKNLEAKVEQRTAELNQTLNEVRTLKEKQDGDYFLTSLLIRPLGGNFARSELVDVQMLTHQKKKFVFRNKESEIGGDINIAHTITLRGRKYIVVLNGDAMGKSIQGAGGALVLGTVFKSIVNRTKLSSAIQERHPEQWLKLSLSELQDVFVSFDGSMLISVVLGLIDEESGMFYYINAEHPYVVLYRNGKASFIEKEFVLRKIGIEIMGAGIHIQALRLQPGDVILLGSDGRDDILMGEDENGVRVINEDESAFLRHVEAGKGELEGIENSIYNTGELTDDFTLLRIEYRKDAPFPDSFASPKADQIADEASELYRAGKAEEAIEHLEKGLKEFPDNPSILRQLIRIHMLQKDYKKVLPYIEAFSKQGREDTDFLYYAAYVYKLAGDLEKAADFGERCRLRNPEHLNNLANLVDIYRLNKNIKRAKELLERGLQMDPNHPVLKKAANALGA